MNAERRSMLRRVGLVVGVGALAAPVLVSVVHPAPLNSERFASIDAALKTLERLITQATHLGGSWDMAHVLHHVAHSLQFGFSFERTQHVGHLRIRERTPAHNAAHEGVLRGHAKQPLGFLRRLPRLHRHHPINPNGLDLLVNILRQEIAADDLHGIVDPVVFLGIVFPEMVVRVDAHSTLDVTTSLRE